MIGTSRVIVGVLFFFYPFTFFFIFFPPPFSFIIIESILSVLLSLVAYVFRVSTSSI